MLLKSSECSDQEGGKKECDYYIEIQSGNAEYESEERFENLDEQHRQYEYQEKD